MIKHIGLITNQMKDPSYEFTEEVRHFLLTKGVDCRRVDTAPGIAPETDCLLVLGGDGTMLQAARDCADRQLPMLGINLGKLGYLAEVEKQNWKEALQQLLDGDFQIEKRMMLEGKLVGSRLKNGFGNETGVGKESVARNEDVAWGENGARDKDTSCKETAVCKDVPEGNPEYALNDVVITRDGSLQIVSYIIYVNGKLLNTFEADGIILSTPTGSTAYNLSAGGPIAEPGAQLMLLTPICPHTLSTRSIILAPQDHVTIEIGPGREQRCSRARASFDGGFDKLMETGDCIEICRSERETSVIKLSSQSFLEILHAKIAQ